MIIQFTRALFERAGLIVMKGPIPEKEYLIPLGVADVKKQGSDIAIVVLGMMVQKALTAANTLLNEKISVEVIDPLARASVYPSQVITSC